LDILLFVFLTCLGLGAFIGFMAGLLGIGGGLIAVPVLLYLLPQVGFDATNVPHVAIATSLAAIILTSLSSARAHHKRGNIPWPVFKLMLPGLMLGSFCAGFISQNIGAQLLQQIFAVFVILMAMQMVFPFKNDNSDRELPAKSVLFICAIIIAIIAGLMGIGGGILLIPFLSWCGLQMRNAIGMSAVSGIFIASFGSIGYILAGLHLQDMPQWTLGYVYLPALLGIIITSVLTAPIGARAASIWPTPLLKKIFAVLLIVTGIKLVLV